MDDHTEHRAERRDPVEGPSERSERAPAVVAHRGDDERDGPREHERERDDRLGERPLDQAVVGDEREGDGEPRRADPQGL